MKHSESGFTLIELVVVIVILGILAATAIPKFANLTVDARQASRSGVEGAVRSASAIAHAQALVDGVATSASGDTITMEGTIDLVYGYPAASATGIEAAVTVSGATAASAGTTTTFTVDGKSTCTVTYDEATGVNNPPGFGGSTACD